MYQYSKQLRSKNWKTHVLYFWSDEWVQILKSPLPYFVYYRLRWKYVNIYFSVKIINKEYLIDYLSRRISKIVMKIPKLNVIMTRVLFLSFLKLF